MQNNRSEYKTPEMQVFVHHIYEYKKGLRNLVLHTMPADQLNKAEHYLVKREIPYFIQHVTQKKVNIFFGNLHCINIIKNVNKNSLNEFTDEEDFMLGIMLGYDRLKQCERYLSRKKSKNLKVS